MHSRDPDLANGSAAMHWAALRARHRVAANGTPVAMYEEGRVTG